MEGLLITARAVHFASVISLDGVLAFECLVAAPAFRAAGASEAAMAALRRRLRSLGWPSLAFALVSSAAWLVALAATISGEPQAAVLSQGTLRVVLIDTRFGEDWLLRLACAVVIAALPAARRESLRRVDPPTRWVGLILATLLLASLACAGHGAATPGAAGNLHLAGDVLHLAAAGLPIRPANLTEAHLFAHTPGELFWWVSHGRANGAMPGFADVPKPRRRWDVINFVRARAAGVQSGAVGSTLATEATAPVPDFAFEVGGTQTTPRQMLERGPPLLVLYEPPAPVARLEELAAGQPGLTTAGLRVVGVKLGDGSDGDEAAPAVVVHVSRKVDKSLALFRVPGSRENELMLDRSGNVRLRWTASNLAPPDRLVAEAERVGRAPLPRRAMTVTSTN